MLWALAQFSLKSPAVVPLVLSLLLPTPVFALQDGSWCSFWMVLRLRSLNGFELVAIHPNLATGPIFLALLFLAFSQDQRYAG